MMRNCTAGCGGFDNGNAFLHAVSEAGLLADLKNYALLRPVLLELKKEWPKAV